MSRPSTRRFRAPSLDRVVAARRSTVAGAALGTVLPDAETLARIVKLAHGITGLDGRGPTPSAGGLQALELYLASWGSGWLAPGWYHYDRRGHHLSQLASGTTRESVAAIVPSLAILDGGALAWILVGDHARMTARYSQHTKQFLLLETNHLMQSLALASASCQLTTVPLGGFYERAIARTLALPRTDLVLYAGALGGVAAARVG